MALKGQDPARKPPPGVAPFPGFRYAGDWLPRASPWACELVPFGDGLHDAFRHNHTLPPPPPWAKPSLLYTRCYAIHRRPKPRPRRGLTRQPRAKPWGQAPTKTHGPERSSDQEGDGPLCDAESFFQEVASKIRREEGHCRDDSGTMGNRYKSPPRQGSSLRRTRSRKGPQCQNGRGTVGKAWHTRVFCRAGA